MNKIKEIDFFKKKITPYLKGYELNYKDFKKGDFGDLHQIEFNSEKIGGNIDFWELGWLGVFMWNYKTDKELINKLIPPDDFVNKEEVFDEILNLLKSIS